MSEHATHLLQQLSRVRTESSRDLGSNEPFDVACFSTMTADERNQFWRGLQQLHDAGQLDTSQLNRFLQTLLHAAPASAAAAEDSAVASVVASLYRTWRDPEQPRHQLLGLLSRQATAEGWRGFAELIASDPPTDTQQAVEVFLPIWRTPEGPFDVLFPRLLDALEHLSVAAIVLDLANYLARAGRLPDHPAHPRADQLTWLLGQLVERLEGFEEASRTEGVRDLKVAQHVQETITLVIAVCHTLSLLGHRDSIGKLYRMLELQHRRLRVEAAAALAKFGEPAGVNTLTEMAAEPRVRLRVHAYASELGILDQIPAPYRQPEALAESELLIRLSEPDLFGVEPVRWAVYDRRQLAWPGYDEPQTCYLFRYTYRFATEDYTNLALVGPVAHALIADLSEYPLDDVYALYAGWSAEHDELQERPLEVSHPHEAAAVSRRVERLRESGYHDLEPKFWGHFFGARLLVLTATRDARRGTVVADEDSDEWIPERSPLRPLGPELAYRLFVGRQLLRRFNADYPGDG